MDPETFTLRTIFLEEFYKDRVKLICGDITINLDKSIEGFDFDTSIDFFLNLTII